MEDVTHKVARQYTAYAYPHPIQDLEAYRAAGQYDQADPSIFGVNVWPEGRPRPDLDILVAGCGANQAAIIAFNNPGCRVVGVDLSETSLGHERYLRGRHRLENLELAQGDLRNVGQLGRDFDLIISSGVLHHLADPGEGLSALRTVLRPEGAMALMVYAAVGRSGIYPLQEAFRRMRLEQNAEGIAVVRAVLAGLPPTHPVQTYIRTVAELEHDTAMVDTFLHPQDRAYTVPELLDWVTANGLEFQNWKGNHLYYPQAMIEEPVLSQIDALPDEDQWVVCDSMLALTGRHSFIARHPGRALRPDFAGRDWLSYRPSYPPYVRVMDRGAQAGSVILYNLDFAVTPAEVEALKGVDGQTTIGAILRRPAFSHGAPEQMETFGRTLFQRLWKAGALMLAMR